MAMTEHRPMSAEPVRFFKAHGLGNDYIALDHAVLAAELTPPAVRLLCDRHVGVGSDGILARVPSDAAEFGVRIFNPDGSEGEKSGNGLRIFALFLAEQGLVRPGQEFTVETRGGVVTMQLTAGGPGAASVDVEVEMGQASFRSASVGLSGPDREVEGELLELEAGDRVEFQPVSIGNPHCVIFTDELDVEDLRRRGPQISTHPWFERGINVQLVKVAGPAELDVLVWERGAGETLASGSSACAAAAAAVRRGAVSNRDVEVRMPGGSLFVTVREDWTLVLRGPVEAVCWGELAAGMLSRLRELA